MSAATGNPVFVTVGGDASNATVTLADGSTKTLTQVGQDGEQASNDAATAKAQSSAAVTSANSALTKANAAIPSSTINQPNGPVATDNTNTLHLPQGLAVGEATTSDWGCNWGNKSSGSEYSWHWNNTGQVVWQTQIWGGSAAGLDGNMSIWGSQIAPAVANKMNLGDPSLPWAAITSQTAVQVISDINEKTVVGTLGDAAYADLTTAFRAIWEEISGVVYTLKDNSNNRKHFGVIAQTVEAAFKKYGLDAGDYGLWCSTPVTVMQPTRTKVLDKNGEPILDTDGNATYITGYESTPVYEADGVTQKIRQSIRYEELLCFGVFCERLNREAIEARLDALEAAAKKTS